MSTPVLYLAPLMQYKMRKEVGNNSQIVDSAPSSFSLGSLGQDLKSH